MGAWNAPYCAGDWEEVTVVVAFGYRGWEQPAHFRLDMDEIVESR